MKLWDVMKHVIGDYHLTVIVDNLDVYHFYLRDEQRQFIYDHCDYKIKDMSINFDECRIYVSISK